jgi:hypothetical protein
MFGLIIEIGIRTSVWVLTKGCQGVYYLCFGDKEAKRRLDLENKVKMLEYKLELLENR